MYKIKKIAVTIVFGVLYFCLIINVILSEEKELKINNVEVDELEQMLETLIKERSELDKLKTKLVETVKQKEDDAKAQKEIELEKNGKVILTNFVKENNENEEKFVDGQSNLAHDNKEVEEGIIKCDEEDEIEVRENVIINGDEIVHPFEIAENLYKLGEYKAAVDIYKMVLKNNIEKDKRIWITYQIANCYRKLELYTDAIEVYKEMRQVCEGTYWDKQAQWYIQDIEWRFKVREELDTVIKK